MSGKRFCWEPVEFSETGLIFVGLSGVGGGGVKIFVKGQHRQYAVLRSKCVLACRLEPRTISHKVFTFLESEC